MPDQPKTQHRSVRINDDDWRDLGAQAEQIDTDRAGLIRGFVRWYLRRPGAHLPKRPAVEDKS